jgi:hypothetical protein
VARGRQVISRLVFHFLDGSLQDETVVYTQRGTFQLVRDHLVQKGPAFPQPMDVKVNATNGQATIHYTDHGQKKVASEHLDLPPDVANGMVLTLLKNVPRNTQQLNLSLVAATPKPRLVKLAISPAGTDSFSIGGSSRQATHYVVKVDLGGVVGLVAPLVGKKPPDSHVWIMYGAVPAFVKSEAPLYPGGPLVRIELTSPVWPQPPKGKSPPSPPRPRR